MTNKDILLQKIERNTKELAILEKKKVALDEKIPNLKKKLFNQKQELERIEAGLRPVIEIE